MQISTETVTQLIKSNQRQSQLEQVREQNIAPSHKHIPDHIKQVASQVFQQFTTMRPAWKVGFTNENKTFDQKQVTAYKIQLLLAMQENGIDSMDKVKSGLKTLRSQPGQFLPSIGDFIAACKPQANGELNCGMYQEYRPERLIAQGTFQERQAKAKSELAKIKQMLGK